MLLDLGKANVIYIYRELEMKNGILTRKFIADIEGYEIEAKVTRFLSLVSKELGVIKYEVKSLNFDGEIMFCPYLDSNVKMKTQIMMKHFGLILVQILKRIMAV